MSNWNKMPAGDSNLGNYQLSSVKANSTAGIMHRH